MVKDKNEGRCNLNIKEEVRDRLDLWASKHFRIPNDRLRHSVPSTLIIETLLDIAEGVNMDKALLAGPAT